MGAGIRTQFDATPDQWDIPMFKLLDYPLVVLVTAFVLLMLSMRIGANVLGKVHSSRTQTAATSISCWARR